MDPTLPGNGTDDPPRLRVRVWFGAHSLCDYRADPQAARHYATAMERRFAGLRVTVDQETTQGLRPLPCEQLWILAP